MIEFNNISKVFNADIMKEPFVALKDVSFSIENGKIIGFLGANGAGKTTSLKILLNFIKPTSGHVVFDPVLGNTRNEIFSSLGFLPERPYFYPHLTGRAYCHYMGKLVDMHSSEIEKQLSNWAGRFRIDFALDREIKSYSKGMLQRVGFLSALIHSPKLIILDEPLAGVDPVGRKELKDIIKEINKEGKTVFFSSHIVSDMEEICDSVIFLDKGKVAYQGSVSELLVKNSKKDFYITYMDNGEIKSLSVGVEKKDKVLRELIQAGNNIISVNQEKLTLEEIFYNVRN